MKSFLNCKIKYVICALLIPSVLCAQAVAIADPAQPYCDWNEEPNPIEQYESEYEVCYVGDYDEGASSWWYDSLTTYFVTYTPPIAAAVAQVFFESAVTNGIQSYWKLDSKSRWLIFAGNLIGTFSRVFVSAVSEPGIMAGQAGLQTTFNSNTGVVDEASSKTQETLIEGISELYGRLGVEAQRSRADFDQMAVLLDQAITSAHYAFSEKSNETQAIALIAYAAKLLRFLHPEFEADDLLLATLAKTQLSEIVGLPEEQRHSLREQIVMQLKNVDSLAGEREEVLADYAKILDSWGIECAAGRECEGSAGLAKSSLLAFDAKGMLMSAGYYGVGAAGYIVPAALKTWASNSNMVTKVLIQFMANQLGFGITNSHSDVIYSNLQRWMKSYGIEDRGTADWPNANLANNKYTSSYRRQKFLLSKQALLARVAVVGCLASVARDFSDAHDALFADREKLALNYLAGAAVYIKKQYPELNANDPYVSETAHVFFSDFVPIPDGFAQKLLGKISGLDPDYQVRESAREKYQRMLKSWGISND